MDCWIFFFLCDTYFCYSKSCNNFLSPSIMQYLWTITHISRFNKVFQLMQILRLFPLNLTCFKYCLHKYKQKKPIRLIISMVAQGGIEPPTQGFSVLCSTD